MLLNQSVDINVFDVRSGHQYTYCENKLYEECSEIFGNLEDLQSSLSDEIEMVLVYK